MRIFTKDKLWRAFPELDRFDDVHCRAFVRVANASWRLRLLRYAVVAVLGGLTIVGGAFAIGALSAWSGRLRLIVTIEMLLLSLGGVVALGIGFGVVLIANDWLRWRRIRRVLAESGKCSDCGYTLLGMSVADDLSVRCPECGTVTQVDASLGELAVSESGQRTFAPVRPRLSQRGVRRRRMAKRIALYGAIGLLGAAIIAAAGAVVFVHIDAARARRHRDGAAKLHALRASLQPIPGSSGTAAVEDAESNWAAYVGLLREFSEAQDRVVERRRDAGKHLPESNVEISFAWRAMEAQSSMSPEVAEQQALDDGARRELALEFLAELDASGWNDRLRAISKCRLMARPVPVSKPASSGKEEFVHIAGVYDAAEWLSLRVGESCRARMFLAASTGDREEYLAALDEGLFIARAVEAQANLLCSTGGAVIEMKVLAVVRGDAAKFADAGFLDEIREVMRERARVVTVGSAIEGEQIAAENMLDWMFSQPWAVLRARVTGELPEPLDDIELAADNRLGTYQANRESLVDFAKSWSESFSVEPSQRRKGWMPPPSEFVFCGSSRFVKHTAGLEDRRMVLWRGTEVVLALEAYKLSHGDYPETLDQLTPEFIERLPNDPFARATFRYLRVDPASDPFGRSYLLYSIGADGVDNGAATVVGENHKALLMSEGNGFDFIINQPEN